MIHKYIIMVCFLWLSLECFSQEQSNKYKVISIDSTNSYYIVFISSDLSDKKLDIDMPVLFEIDGSYYHFSKFDKTKINFLLSPKIKGLNRNIYIDSIYELSINCVTNNTMNEANEHIGHGDFLFRYPSEDICTSKEIVGLLYTQNVDSLNIFSAINFQHNLFDINMFKIWLHAKSGLSYYQWLKKQLDNIMTKSIFCNEKLNLYYDVNLQKPYPQEEKYKFCNDDIIKLQLLYKQKRKYFVQIGSGSDKIYAWIKSKEIR